MIPRSAVPLALTLLLALARPALAGDAPPAPDTAAAAPAGEAPLLLDPGDMGLGVSVMLRRIPTPADIASLAYYDAVQHLVLLLPGWPDDFAQIEPLARAILPQGCDVIVVLNGYPDGRSRIALWNLVRQPLRIVLSVDGPPADRGMITELNAMRGLERVIATMDRPARSGFERLQRPLSFRVLAP